MFNTCEQSFLLGNVCKGLGCSTLVFVIMSLLSNKYVTKGASCSSVLTIRFCSHLSLNSYSIADLYFKMLISASLPKVITHDNFILCIIALSLYHAIKHIKLH